MEEAILRLWPLLAGFAGVSALGLKLLWQIARTATRTELILTANTTQLSEHKAILSGLAERIHEHDRRLGEVEGIVRPLVRMS
jgi:hypothetical protein